MDTQLIKDLQKAWSVLVQKELYNSVIDEKKHGRQKVDVLAIDTTIMRLKRAGYFDHPDMSAKQMCEVLGVDAIIISKYTFSEPYSNSEGVMLELIARDLSPFMNAYPLNKAVAILEIYDRESPKPVWGYINRKTTSLGTSHGEIVYNVVRLASRKMPYGK
ncbi:MAG: hypothetical protein IT261_09105 [Saprospiraceae bacterium]|nr:hypothetical protein [Saprospiraceae bacterium]